MEYENGTRRQSLATMLMESILKRATLLPCAICLSAIMLVVIVPLSALAADATRAADPEQSAASEFAAQISEGVETAPQPAGETLVAATAVIKSAADAPLDDLLKRDPAAFIIKAHEQFKKNVQGYTCTLTKQELVKGTLTSVQEIELRVREKPRMVYMLWRKNEADARRALFIDDPQYRDKKGVMQARVEPAGSIARLFVSDLMVPIRGGMAESASRRTIDECGFGPFYALFERYHEQTRRNKQQGPDYLTYAGPGRIDGRATYIFIRHLPYTGEKGEYPDARLVMHIEQERLLPVSIYSYADRQEKKLLGSYVFTNVKLNPAFDEAAFKF